MSDPTWAAVDDYLASLRPADPLLDHIRERSRAERLPDISVSREQGMLLTVLGRGVNARRVLEIGTLGGYSAGCLARGLPDDGRVITLEADETHARVARENLAAAGLAGRVSVVTGPALETLPDLAATHPHGFDLIFIDADKESYPAYWDWALRLSHPGTLVIADNVVRDGEVADGGNTEAQVVGVRAYLQRAATEPAVVTSTVQTVGAKGHDGLSFSVVLRNRA